MRTMTRWAPLLSRSEILFLLKLINKGSLHFSWTLTGTDVFTEWKLFILPKESLICNVTNLIDTLKGYSIICNKWQIWFKGLHGEWLVQILFKELSIPKQKTLHKIFIQHSGGDLPFVISARAFLSSAIENKPSQDFASLSLKIVRLLMTSKSNWLILLLTSHKDK